MKKRTFLAMSMAAALTVGCSSDDITDNGGGVNKDGKAYVGLSITLPTTSGIGGRANGDFNAGLADEYKVNDLTIYYFSPNDLVNPIHSQTYSSADLNWSTPPAGDDITTRCVLPVASVDFSGTVKALVVVNNPVNWSGTAEDKFGKNKPVTTTADDITGEDKDDFYMTNAVYADGHYLVDVKTYNTEVEAQNHAAEQNIYVERAAAKVELMTHPSIENNALKVSGEMTYQGDSVVLDKWILDVTNMNMFPIRKFAGTTQFDDTNFFRFYQNGIDHRTYWAEDPNYSSGDPTYNTYAAFNVISDPAAIKNTIGAGNYEYCLENTFSVPNQKQNETTRVLMKATYTPKNFTKGANWYTLGSSSTPLQGTDIAALIAKALNYGVAEDAKVTVTFKDDVVTQAGKQDITAEMIELSSGTLSNDQLKMVRNTLGELTAYIKGECFYVVRIKHFGDTYCPWGKETDAPIPTGQVDTYVKYIASYNGNRNEMDKFYLGRYGVVRNNWYRVQVNTVSQPGTPTIPVLSTEQDDEHYNYIQTTINILDWAVRNQGVDL